MGTELVEQYKLDIAELKTQLFPVSSSGDSPTSSPQPPPRQNWITECCVALSDDGDMAAVSKDNILVISKKQSNKAWDVFPVDTQSPSDRISSISIVNFGKAQLSHCMCVGFQNGYLRIYNSKGILLVSQRFHATTILRLVPHSTDDEHHTVEDLMVLYEGGVVVAITGLSLVAAVMLTQAHSADSTQSSLPPTLSYRKWLLFGAEVVTDAIYIPPHAVHTEAFGAGRVVSVGRNPIISFYSITEEQDNPLSVAVALASTVASKLTSAVVSFAKSWWRPAAAPEENPEPKDKSDAAMEAAVSLSVRKSLSDAQRHLYSLTASPSGNLSVATDGFGRVLLVDMKACLVIRMWKGYRDAQCGWILHDDKLYLVLHAPRRGLVEIWRMRHGSRVGVHLLGQGWKVIPLERSCHLLSPAGAIHTIRIK